MYRYSRPNVQTSIPASRSPSCVAKNRCALPATSIACCPARCYSRERCQKPLGSEVPSNMRHSARLGGIILYYAYALSLGQTRIVARLTLRPREDISLRPVQVDERYTFEVLRGKVVAQSVLAFRTNINVGQEPPQRRQ